MAPRSRESAAMREREAQAELRKLTRAAGPISRLIKEGSLQEGHVIGLHETFIGKVGRQRTGRTLFTRTSGTPERMSLWETGAINRALKLRLTVAGMKHKILVPAEQASPTNTIFVAGENAPAINLRGFQLTPAARDSLIAWGKLRGMKPQAMQPEQVGLSPGMRKFLSRIGKGGKLVVSGIVRRYRVIRPMSKSAIENYVKPQRKESDYIQKP